MTYDEFEVALLAIIAPLHDLKEKVLLEGIDGQNSKGFDGGMLAAHSEALLRLLDVESDPVKAETERQIDQRLRDVLKGT